MTMKTALLHYSAPPVIGGVEAVMLAHARQFVQAGMPIAVIAGSGDASALPAGCEFFPISEMDTQHYEILRLSAALEQGQVLAEFEALTQRLTDVLRPVVTRFDRLLVHNVLTKHFNLPLTAALFRLMDEGATHGVYAWCHDLTWTSPTSRSKVMEAYPWNLLRTARPDVSYVAVSMQRQKETAETFGLPLEKVRVIYNGVDQQALLGISPETSTLADRLGIWDADLVLLMPVRITQAKNIEYAMELMAALKRSDYRARLVVTGPPDPHEINGGAYFQELLDLRRRMKLEQEFRFVYESGPNPAQPYQIDQASVAGLLRLSDLMFMPSHHEGFGLPVLEAGLVGVPVVTTAVPAALEIALEDAFVFSLNTAPDMLVEQLLNWIEENSQYQLRRRVRRDFTWQAIFQREIKPLLEGSR
ncbi:MAG: glycosyltransferase family 4 protein [Bellilinea sp.]